MTQFKVRLLHNIIINRFSKYMILRNFHFLSALVIIGMFLVRKKRHTGRNPYYTSETW